MSTEVAVRVTEHDGFLVMDTLVEHSTPELVVPGEDNTSMGVVALNLKLVGVSKEAYAAMQDLKPGRDGIGAIDCFKTTGNPDQPYAFGFIGFKSLIDTRSADDETTSRQWDLAPYEMFTEIDNDTPEGALEAINEMRSESSEG